MTKPFPPSFNALDRYGAYTDLEALKQASLRPLRKSKRVNTLKCTTEAFLIWAKEREWTTEQVPWCAEGYYIDREDRETALGKDLLHLLGHTYMQEAASMLPVALLNPQPGETILDMSAAPGSKTTQIASMMQGRGVIIANDVQEQRLWTLKNSLHRCGVTNVIVTKKVGQWFARNMTERFDRVLCDAPCTAQGTVRKDSDALTYCSAENIGKMAKLQRELLEAAIDAAKVGGVIVYSTCTLTPEENEEVIASILNKFGDQIEPLETGLKTILSAAIEDSNRVQEYLGFSNKFPACRLWPQTYDTEGFFAAVLRKVKPTRAREHREAVRFLEDRLPRSRQTGLEKEIANFYGSSFLLPDDRLLQLNDRLILSTEEVVDFSLPVKNYALGMPFGKRLDESRVRLDHDLATLRGPLAQTHCFDLSAQQLQDLLDGKDTTCDVGLRGDVLLRFKGRSLGFGLAKDGHLKNRLPRWLVMKS